MASTETGKKRLPWGRIVLAVSLAFNLLIAGMYVGAKLSGKGPDKRGDRSQISALAGGPYGRALSREDRKALGQKFREQRRAAPNGRREMREIGLELAAAMQASPFQAETVTALLKRQSEVVGRVQARNLDGFADYLVAMTPEARMAYGAELEKILTRRKNR